MKVEVALGRRRTWYGRARPGAAHARPARGGRSRRGPGRRASRALADWVRRLRREHPDGATGPVRVHRSSDPGHWIVAWPWAMEDRAKAIAEAALALVERDVSPATGAPRWRRPAAAARAASPRGSSAAARRRPGVHPRRGPAAADRLDQRHERQDHHDPADRPHPARGRQARRRDDVRRRSSSDGEMVEPGDWTGSGRRAAQILTRGRLDIAVLETARGGILLRGRRLRVERGERPHERHLRPPRPPGHPHPARARRGQVDRSRGSRSPTGWVVLNADDRYVAGDRAAGSARRVAFFSLERRRSARVRRHLRGGGRAYLVRDGWHRRGRGRSLAAHREARRRAGRARRHRPPQRRERAGRGGAARGRWAPRSTQVARRACAPSVPTAERLARAPQRLPGRAAGSSSSTSPTTRPGVGVLLDVAEAIAGAARRGAAGRRAGHVHRRARRRPAGRHAPRRRPASSPQRADRFVQKEMLHYLRGRTRESVLGEIRGGRADGGWTRARSRSTSTSRPPGRSAELDRTEGVRRTTARGASSSSATRTARRSSTSSARRRTRDPWTTRDGARAHSSPARLTAAAVAADERPRGASELAGVGEGRARRRAGRRCAIASR